LQDSIPEKPKEAYLTKFGSCRRGGQGGVEGYSSKILTCYAMERDEWFINITR